MPDQDEFAPLAPQWTSVLERFLVDDDPRKIADEAYRLLKQMLRRFQGCPSLPQLVSILETFDLAITDRRGQGWQLDEQIETTLEATLDRLSRAIDNRRMDAVAVRSCRITAIQMTYDTFSRNGFSSLGEAFTTQMLRHAICHFFLDRSRAFRRGSSNDTYSAQSNYQRVLECMEPMLRRYARKLLEDPTAQFIVRDPRLVPQTGTAAILDDDDYRLDDEEDL